MSRSEIKIKICGMKFPENIEGVARLKPDFMGFILYKGSPRYVSQDQALYLTESIPKSISKVGVLVNEPLEKAIEIAKSGIFNLLQLHGNESAEYCRTISEYIGIIKAFRLSDSLPGDIPAYEPYCNMFLFDTASEGFGGSGKKFNHAILSGYQSDKDYLISGGISADDSEYVSSLHSGHMAGIDINSKFETEPGLKDIRLIEQFIKKLRKNVK